MRGELSSHIHSLFSQYFSQIGIVVGQSCSACHYMSNKENVVQPPSVAAVSTTEVKVRCTSRSTIPILVVTFSNFVRRVTTQSSSKLT